MAASPITRNHVLGRGGGERALAFGHGLGGAACDEGCNGTLDNHAQALIDILDTPARIGRPVLFRRRVLIGNTHRIVSDAQVSMPALAAFIGTPHA